MPRSFKLPPVWSGARAREPRVILRAVLGVLVVANLVAAVIALKPFGGSAEDLRREEASLRSRLAESQGRLARSKALAAKVDAARAEGDQFLNKYVTDRRVTYSVIEEELNRMAKEAGIKARESSKTLEPIEGSDTLSMMTINANYEGNYASLNKFVNLLDKSPRFIIIESMTAMPQQGGANLIISMKLDAFVKDLPGGRS